MRTYGRQNRRGAFSPTPSVNTDKSSLVQAHLPCSTCGSSDALARYSDGHTYCFACEDRKNLLDNSGDDLYNKETGFEGDIPLYNSSSSNHLSKPIKDRSLIKYKESRGVGWRGIEGATMDFYGVTLRSVDDGTNRPLAYSFPWGGDSKQIRMIANKEFYMEGSAEKAQPLFGMDKFPAGSATAITITEGALDAMSAYQMLGSKYPAVSVRSSSSARKDCTDAYKYLDSFEKIYLAFDADAPGEKALKAVAGLFNPNKVFIVPISAPYKDANDYLKDGKTREFHKAWWSAKKHRPKGIIESFDDIGNILASEDAKAVAEYPFPTLQSMTYGIRLGEVILITAQEKVGKTAFMSCLEHNVIKKTDYGVGIIHLEQSQKRSIQGLLNYETDRATNLPDSGFSHEDLLAKYKDLVKKEGRVHFYSHFGSDDPDSILEVMRYLVAVCGCKFIFLDHITMLATGREGDDERRMLDFISTRMAMLTRELGFTLFLVSHVNDDGKTRGSRNISKIADLIIHLDRDNEAESYDERHTTKMVVKGNRDIAASGPAGYLWFDDQTYTLKEKETTDVEIDEAVPF